MYRVGDRPTDYRNPIHSPAARVVRRSGMFYLWDQPRIHHLCVTALCGLVEDIQTFYGNISADQPWLQFSESVIIIPTEPRGEPHRLLEMGIW